MKQLLRLCACLAGLILLSSSAGAVVGGLEDAGPVAQASVMVVTPMGMCSAVALAPDVVLTAAHCLDGVKEYRVHFRDAAGKPVLLAPSAHAVHPGYDAKAVAARRVSIDLALLRIAEPLPARFIPAVLSGEPPAKGAAVTVGGYGVEDPQDAKSAGTFRTAALASVEPYGPSRVLLWAEGRHAGACQGDSGGPMASGGAVVAITTWATAAGGPGCGGLTQGVLVGPQRAWIDRVLKGWRRDPHWR